MGILHILFVSCHDSINQVFRKLKFHKDNKACISCDFGMVSNYVEKQTPETCQTHVKDMLFLYKIKTSDTIP